MDDDKGYSVDNLAEFDRNLRRFVKKKRFFALPGQIDELICKFENGDFDGDLIIKSDSPVEYEVYKPMSTT